MPRFGTDTRAEPRQPARQQMGMQAAFAGSGGLLGDHDRGLAATSREVIHQANIDVDEKGTEAAAATAVSDGHHGGCTGPESGEDDQVLRFNRPFLFVIRRDVETGAILFMGRVVDPTVRS